MNLNNISLPYPVLGISDDVIPLLPDDSVSVNFTKDVKNYIFVIDLKFKNKDIERYLQLEKAEYACEYECARTMLRRCQKSSDSHFEIKINRKEINSRLNFSCYICVKKQIENYCNTGFNLDYENATFDMSSGDILVAFPQFHYDADIKYDKLQAVGSFMQIRESSLHPDVFFDISHDKIEILMPKVLYRLYCNPLVKGSSEIIHSSLVLNALTFALLNIRDHEHTTWAKTIYYRFQNEDGFSIEELEEVSNIPSLAQRLLKDPYSRLFNHIVITKSNTLSE